MHRGMPIAVRHRVPWHRLPGVGVALSGHPSVGQIDAGPCKSSWRCPAAVSGVRGTAAWLRLAGEAADPLQGGTADVQGACG